MFFFLEYFKTNMEHNNHMEYTLDDAFDTLVEKMNECEKNIEDFTNRISNNEVNAVQATSSREDLRTRGDMLLQKYLKEVLNLQPQDYAVPRTVELHAEVFRDLESEIKDMQFILNKLDKTLLDIQADMK